MNDFDWDCHDDYYDDYDDDWYYLEKDIKPIIFNYWWW